MTVIDVSFTISAGKTIFIQVNRFFFRTANSSWPELSFPYCAKAGLPADRSSGLTPSRFPSGFCLPSRITVTSSYRIHTCFPFHRINRNLLSSDTLRFSMWSIFGNFYRYLFNRMSISFCVHTVNHYSVIVGKTHEKNAPDAVLSALTPFFKI